MSDLIPQHKLIIYTALFSVVSMLSACNGAEKSIAIAQELLSNVDLNQQSVNEQENEPENEQDIEQFAANNVDATRRLSVRHEPTSDTSVSLTLSDIASRKAVDVVDDTTDYTDFKLVDYTPQEETQFTHFNPYTLSIHQPLPELIDEQIVYLKVMDDQGNQLYLNDLPSDQIMELDFELESAVETLYLQFFADNIETVMGVVSI